MTEILIAVCKAVTRRNGKIAIDVELELPAGMDADQRREIAEPIARYFEERDVAAHWAIHTRANRRNNLRDSNRRWMKNRGQVRSNKPTAPQ